MDAPPRRLVGEEKGAWDNFIRMQEQLVGRLSRHVQSDSGMSASDYVVLTGLTERGGGRMRLLSSPPRRLRGDRRGRRPPRRARPPTVHRHPDAKSAHITRPYLRARCGAHGEAVGLTGRGDAAQARQRARHGPRSRSAPAAKTTWTYGAPGRRGGEPPGRQSVNRAAPSACAQAVDFHTSTVPGGGAGGVRRSRRPSCTPRTLAGRTVRSLRGDASAVPARTPSQPEPRTASRHWS